MEKGAVAAVREDVVVEEKGVISEAGEDLVTVEEGGRAAEEAHEARGA
eukprot:CAMPEP_0114248798 /NCGR_PEP_ID=MMETSP0058-20121206/13775_1 /TAXON_ID=36894 /ORGANISM="Pyramimonas parkeae, CCMP726" /LENGTH=47 /DNA_ID= /DNA_START= /DNA_END= /DNA_ORIENTATION=